ncbi:30S ribosomal protein S5 [Candidatus Uhrbacteria bacterium]|nr:30S ribosomal protein S5 [Candidatus Uhrbacteria bacterium]
MEHTKPTNAPARPKREGGRGGSPSSRAGGGRGEGQGERRGRGRGRGGKRDERAPREFEQKILDLARVTRVTAGGKRMSFRCALVIGDKKGRVGFGVAKGGDVQIAIEKAYKQAKKHVLTVPLTHGTISHPVWVKFGSAMILLKPAPKGTGLKSGGAVRMVLEFAGVPNVVSKIINSSNKINIAKATLEALTQLRAVEEKAPQVAEKETQPVAVNA